MAVQFKLGGHVACWSDGKLLLKLLKLLFIKLLVKLLPLFISNKACIDKPVDNPLALKLEIKLCVEVGIEEVGGFTKPEFDIKLIIFSGVLELDFRLVP